MSQRILGVPEVVDLTGEEDPNDEEEKVPLTEEILATINEITITRRHQQILQDIHEWLTDEVINAFCGRVSAAKPTVHCCSTFFYTKIASSMDEEWLRRWKRTVNLPKDLIIIPVNWNDSHWALVVYDIRASTLKYYDSMMSGSRSREALGTIKEAFEKCQLVKEPSSPPTKRCDDAVGVLAFIMSKISMDDTEDINPLKMETPKNQPQQTDGSSCGVFVCWWIAKLSGFITSAPPNPILFRKRILEAIITNPP
jgi:Ulp1 family protease